MDAAAIEAAIAALQAPVADPLELAEDDEGRAVALFLALDTQWAWAATGMVQGNGGYGMRVGLKYEVIAPTAAALGLTVDRRTFLDLREMEAEALRTMAEAQG